VPQIFIYDYTNSTSSLDKLRLHYDMQVTQISHNKPYIFRILVKGRHLKFVQMFKIKNSFFQEYVSTVTLIKNYERNLLKLENNDLFLK